MVIEISLFHLIKNKEKYLGEEVKVNGTVDSVIKQYDGVYFFLRNNGRILCFDNLNKIEINSYYSGIFKVEIFDGRESIILKLLY